MAKRKRRRLKKSVKRFLKTSGVVTSITIAGLVAGTTMKPVEVSASTNIKQVAKITAELQNEDIKDTMTLKKELVAAYNATTNDDLDEIATKVVMTYPTVVVEPSIETASFELIDTSSVAENKATESKEETSGEDTADTEKVAETAPNEATEASGTTDTQNIEESTVSEGMQEENSEETTVNKAGEIIPDGYHYVAYVNGNIFGSNETTANKSGTSFSYNSEDGTEKYVLERQSDGTWLELKTVGENKSGAIQKTSAVATYSADEIKLDAVENTKEESVTPEVEASSTPVATTEAVEDTTGEEVLVGTTASEDTEATSETTTSNSTTEKTDAKNEVDLDKEFIKNAMADTTYTVSNQYGSISLTGSTQNVYMGSQWNMANYIVGVKSTSTEYPMLTIDSSEIEVDDNGFIVNSEGKYTVRFKLTDLTGNSVESSMIVNVTKDPAVIAEEARQAALAKAREEAAKAEQSQIERNSADAQAFANRTVGIAWDLDGNDAWCFDIWAKYVQDNRLNFDYSCHPGQYVHMVYKKYWTSGASKYFDLIDASDVQAGDWLFWDEGSSCPLSHVALLLQNNGDGTGIVLSQSHNRATEIISIQLDVLGGFRRK